MKINKLLIVFFIGLNFTLFAQDINLSESELKSTLCKQWKFEYSMMGGSKMTGADLDINFHSNGDYYLIDQVGTKKGKWIYNTENKYVELYIENMMTSHIKSVDKNGLLLIIPPIPNDPTGSQDMEIHFKVK